MPKTPTAPTAPTGIYERIAPILMIVVVALAFAVGVLWQKVSDLGRAPRPSATNPANAPVPQGPVSVKLDVAQAEALPKVSSDDHIRGSADAEIILIEYSDFECPFCASFHPTAQQALDEYGDRIAWVYRHFPLESIHPKARPAANASECIAEIAGEEAFWRFADEVFGNPTSLNDLSATAVKVGANKAAFDSCLSENRFNEVVDADYNEGLAAGVTGTPGNFIVNKKGEVWKLPGAVPYTSLKQTIEEALAS